MFPSDTSHLLAYVQSAVLFITTAGNIVLAWKTSARFDEFDRNLQDNLRPVSAVLVGLIAVLLGTKFFERCSYSSALIVSSVAVGLADVAIWVWYYHVKSRYTIAVSRDGPDDTEAVRTVKGTDRTPAAEEIFKRTGKSDRDLLVDFGNRPDRVWTSESRNRARTKLLVFDFLRVLGLCCAIILGILGVSLWVENRLVEKKLEVWTQGDCKLHSNEVCALGFNIRGCDVELEWSTEPPNIGTFHGKDRYQAPEVNEHQWVKLKATMEGGQLVRLIPIELLPPEVGGENPIVAPILGSGGSESQDFIEVRLVSANHSWVCGSDQTIKGNVDGPVFLKRFATQFSRYTDLISFGAASREYGNKVDRIQAVKEEDDRAGRRADKLAGWLDEVVGQSKPVYEANLGKYDPDLRLSQSACPLSGRTYDPFADERRLIVVGVIRNKPWPEDKLAAEVRRVFQENQTKEPLFKSILEKYRANWSLARYVRK